MIIPCQGTWQQNIKTSPAKSLFHQVLAGCLILQPKSDDDAQRPGRVLTTCLNTRLIVPHLGNMANGRTGP